MTHKTVCIVGMSYCGSTMLSGLAHNIPGAFPGGELHWLFRSDGSQRLHLCSHCGAGCPVFDAIEPGVGVDGIYAEVARCSGAEILITSDKNRWMIEMLTKPHEARMILLFKNPVAQLASDRRHRSQWVVNTENAASVYDQWYTAHLYWLAHYAEDFVVVEYEKLCADPQGQLEAICAKLELPAPVRPFVYPPPVWHNVGGNAHAWNWGNGPAPIAVDERWRTEISPEDVAIVQNHAACADTYRRLQALAI